MRTMAELAGSACWPWSSIDAGKHDGIQTLPQQEIDICLMCPLHSETCDDCDGHGNIKKRNRKASGKPKGRPKAEIDTELLREMMKLKQTNKAMCAALGVGITTLQQAKKSISKEDNHLESSK